MYGKQNGKKRQQTLPDGTVIDAQTGEVIKEGTRIRKYRRWRSGYYNDEFRYATRPGRKAS